MSWGERSCKKPCRAEHNLSFGKCNVSCEGYEWDGVTKQDTIKRKEAVTIDNIPQPEKLITGRNHPCKCGSGKKAKFCCLKKVYK